MNQSGDFWCRYFSDFFILEIELFTQRMHLALPSDEEVTEEANRAENEVITRQSQFADEDTDPAAFYESAHDQGLAIYSALIHLRQGLVNLFAIGLFHLFEQQLFIFHRRGLQTGQKVRLSLETVQQTLLKDYDLDITKLSCWPDIELLKLVANCAKHSEGGEKDACAKLRAAKPEFFRNKLFGVEDDWAYPESGQPLAGDGLFIEPADFDRLAAAVKSFWLEFGAMIAVM